MTEDQIKAIAEEYCVTQSNDAFHQIKWAEDAISVIKWLLTRYCIVEMDKVMEEYEDAQWHKEVAEGMNIQYGKGMASGQIKTLENLFNISMFNQNEE